MNAFRTKSISLVLAGALGGFLLAGALPSASNVSFAHSKNASAKLSSDLAKMKADIAKLKNSIQIAGARVESNRRHIAQNKLQVGRNTGYVNRWKKLPLH